MIDFENLDYKDITKDKPIHFRECLGEFFDSTYPYSKRFYKQEERRSARGHYWCQFFGRHDPTCVLQEKSGWTRSSYLQEKGHLAPRT